MKLRPFYRSPFSAFEPVTRKEAARLLLQWRRYENASVRRMIRGRGYLFTDWFSSTDAALILK